MNRLYVLVVIRPSEAKKCCALLGSHAGLCVVMLAITPAPRDDWLDIAWVSVMGFNQYIINPVITICTGVAMYVQIATSCETTQLSALTRRTVGMLPGVYMALAVSWLFRFKVPANRWPCDYWVLVEWYPLVGWAGVNAGIVGVGWCAVVYYAMGKGSASEERAALLGS